MIREFLSRNWTFFYGFTVGALFVICVVYAVERFLA